MPTNEGTKLSIRSVKLPIKKYQNFASVAAIIGFLLGALISLSAFAMGIWSCPFGSGVVSTGVFVLLMGILGAVLIGNGAALVLIFVTKRRQAPNSCYRERTKN